MLVINKFDLIPECNKNVPCTPRRCGTETNSLRALHGTLSFVTGDTPTNFSAVTFVNKGSEIAFKSKLDPLLW